jgi:hypothetical protein
MSKKSFFVRFTAGLFAALLIVSSVSITVSSPSILEESPSTEIPMESTTDTYVTEPSDVPTEPSAPPLIDIPVLYSELEYVEYTSVNDAEEFKNEVSRLIEQLQAAVDSEQYTEGACADMRAEVTRLTDIVVRIDANIESIRLWEARYKEYPYATMLWQYLKSEGYSDIVCAGIIGNFMTETGGHTLALRPHIYDSTGVYYGMAQWSGKYHAEVRGAGFEKQCEYLVKTMKKEFDTFGYKYKTNFNYDTFINMTSPEAAAMAFAKCYERCTPVSYNKRQNGARIAYNYFT